MSRALSSIGDALSSGDAPAIATLWDVPGLVLADEGTKAIAARDEVAQFFAQAIRWYRDRGTPVARSEPPRVEWISDRLAAVSVDWLGLDSNGIEQTRESSFYIMRLGDDGVARIQVAMSRVAASR